MKVFKKLMICFSVLFGMICLFAKSNVYASSPSTGIESSYVHTVLEWYSTYKGELSIGSFYNAYSSSDEFVYYYFKCPLNGTYCFSSTDSKNHAEISLYDIDRNITTGDGFIKKDMVSGEEYYISFYVNTKISSKYNIFVDMIDEISVNKISSVGNSRIGSNLPSDYENTTYYEFTVSKTAIHRFFTEGDIDTIIYVYVDGKLKYIEDDQDAYDGECDADLNAYFNERLYEGQKITVVVSTYRNGYTKINHSIIC